MLDAFLEPRKAQWLVLVAVLLVVIPALVFLVVPNDATLVLMRRFEVPTLQASLGFSAAGVSLPPISGSREQVFTITSVTPGGAFWRAGIRPGDVPTGYKHGREFGFILDLVWGKKDGFVKLRFVPAEAVEKGQWQLERSVTVVYPQGVKRPAT